MPSEHPADSPIRVVVTGVGGGTIGEQVCKALRQGRERYHLVATNTRPEPLAVADVEAREALPPASAPDYLERLLALCQRHRARFLVPGSEPELLAVAAQRQRLEACGVSPLVNAAGVIGACVDKLQTFAALQAAGIRAPRTWEVGAGQAVARPEAPYPLIVKPVFGGGSAATFLAQDAAELDFFTAYLLRHGQRALVQEYCGRPEQELTVGVLHYPDGTLHGTAVMRRELGSALSSRVRLPNRTGRPELGPTLVISSGISQGSFVDLPQVRQRAEAIAAALGSVGPLNIQGRLEDGELLPFEINPRFSGTSAMRAAAGFNEPEALVRWHLGRPPAPPSVPPRGDFVRGLMEYRVPDPR